MTEPFGDQAASEPVAGGPPAGGSSVGPTVGPPGLWIPALKLDAQPGRCRLTLVGVTYGNGATMQDAVNDLLVRLHDLALGLRRGHRFTGGAGAHDPRVCEFLWEIGELTLRGADIRPRVFAI